MKLNFLFVTLASCFFSVNVNAQDDLDAVFDDGDNTRGFDVFVGTDLITAAGGTLNLYSEFRIKKMVSVFAGVGTSPFGFLADYSSIEVIFNDGDFEPVSRNVIKSHFFDFGLKYTLNSINYVPFYIYVDYKKWGWSYDSIDLTGDLAARNKYTGGLGHLFVVSNKIGIDLHLGVFLGKEKYNPAGPGKISVSDYYGLDLGLNISYIF